MSSSHNIELLKRSVAEVCRYLLAVVFLFSGFVKAVDPTGGALKFSEYAAAVSVYLPDTVYMIMSIALSAFEMALGASLFFRVARKLTINAVVVVMLFFTTLTLVIAVWNPVADCGCFGEAVKLSNWGTFYKNLILLNLALLLYYFDIRLTCRAARVDYAFVVLFFGLSALLSGYSLYHLPPIDFLPYKVGKNLVVSADGGEVKTTLIYRNRESGALEEFTLEDTEWYDTIRYEYVDTRVEELVSSDFVDFSLFKGDENVSKGLLESEGVVLVILSDAQAAEYKCMQDVVRLLEQATDNNYSIYVLSSTIESPSLSIGNHTLEVLYMDPITRQMLLRASAGVVVLNRGVITGKWNCRNIPSDFIKNLHIVQE